jgi:type I restriction enzyme S subunit
VVNIYNLDKNIYCHYIEQLSLYPGTYIYENSAAKDKKTAVRINEIFNIKKGTLQSTKATPGPYRFITASDEYLTHENFTLDTEALVVAVAAGGSLGKPQYAKGKFIASDLCFVLTPKRKLGVDILFYLYYFKAIRTILVRSLAKGVGKQSINKTDFGNFRIDSFDLDEQRAMGADIFTAREKISKLEDEIHLLDDELIGKISKMHNKG